MATDSSELLLSSNDENKIPQVPKVDVPLPSVDWKSCPGFKKLSNFEAHFFEHTDKYIFQELTRKQP
jgi:hypothetical protein